MGPKQTFATFHKAVELKAYQPSQGYWPTSFMAQGFLHAMPEEKEMQVKQRD